MPKANRRKKRKNGAAAGLVHEWSIVALAFCGAVGVGLGAFDWQAGLPWYSLLLGVAIIAAAIRDVFRRFKGAAGTGKFAGSIEGPLLWTVLIWILFRLSGPLRTHTLLMPVAFFAWLAAISELKIVAGVAFLVLLMEAALTMLGIQSPAVLCLNLAALSMAFFGLRFFTGSEVYRQEFKAKSEKKQVADETEKYAKDLGLLSGKKNIREALPGLDDFPDAEAGGKPLLSMVPALFEAQLGLLRQSLDLTTVALLWADSGKQVLRLRGMSSVRHDILPGPFQIGDGVTGAFLRDVDEMSLAPVTAGFAGLPYYRKTKGVGGIFAIRIPLEGEAGYKSGNKKIEGLLVADRQNDEPWSAAELAVFHSAVAALTLDINMGREFQNMHREHGAFQRVCIGLRELNRALGLESVLEAAMKAVKTLFPADFLAISLLQEGFHKVVRVEGEKTGHLLGKEFHVDEGLIGQVLKLNCPLPAGNRYRGPAPVFSDDARLSGYNSLLVMPLRKENYAPVGALTVASKRSGIITEAHQEILSLIADQVAVKIDLGQAHEQINRLATTDGLTGLANHRSFQHGLSIMLDRAVRQSHPICLIICDIDHFKQVNDNYGHPFGDQVLKAVSGVLRGAVRKIDLAARYGGEEFAIVLEKWGEDGGRQMAERIRKEVAGLKLSYERKNVTVTMSFGVSSYPQDGTEKQEIIDRADKALYHSKETGRDRTTLWSDLSLNAE